MKPQQNSSLTVVVNLSLRNIRLVIFENYGVKIYEDYVPVQTYTNALFVEQDPNEWWRLLVVLLNKLSKKKRIAARVSYITVTSSALCLVLIDKKGNAIGKSMQVSDKRAFKESTDLKTKFVDLFAGHAEWKVEPSFMLPKIMWLKRHRPKIFQKTAWFMSANDYLLYKLTGKIITDEFYSARKNRNIQKSLPWPGRCFCNVLGESR